MKSISQQSGYGKRARPLGRDKKNMSDQEQQQDAHSPKPNPKTKAKQHSRIFRLRNTAE
jgi:hypothetical protein